MRPKVQRTGRLRRVVLAAAAVLTVGAAQHAADVRGHVTLLEKGNRQGNDVGQAVVWLDTRRPVQPVTAEITTSEKSFSPHVLVVPAGSTVSFPNHDPFNHNVFSLSEEQPFDLGLYGNKYGQPYPQEGRRY
jgi:plastocyanin